ncbi:MAG: D-aminoacylase [Synergistales bacterium]|nr:D-aminoacylase [Synergistales bacterium]
MSFDLIIKNARIYDGTRTPWFRGDVGVTGGKIEYIGKLPPDIVATEVIDANNSVLCPGFIDIHAHSDFMLLRDSVMLSKLSQGVTTQIIGMCGVSPAPVSEETLDLLDQYVGFTKAGAKPDWNWRSVGDWLSVLEKLDLGTNVGTYVGQGTIRIAVMGFADRNPTTGELSAMKQLVEDSMEQGAVGLSSGLIYPPGVYSSRDEIISICKGLMNKHGIYESHVRSESYGVVDGVKETIEVGERLGIPVQISHHKAAGKDNWGLVKLTLDEVEKARARGVDITVNQYPYTACSTTLRAILPPWVHEGGVGKLIERLRNTDYRKRIKEEIKTQTSWENFIKHCGNYNGVYLLYTPQTPEFEGKSLKEAAEITGKDELDTAFDIIIENQGLDTAGYEVMSEEDVKYVLKHPSVIVASDSIPAAPGAKSHPRAFGTNPRVLGKYVREEKTLSMEEAIWKMTGFPAARMGLWTKGLIRIGMDADIVLFDPETVKDQATFADPFKEAQGIEYVIVCGKIVVKEGKYTGISAGKVIRK